LVRGARAGREELEASPSGWYSPAPFTKAAERVDVIRCILFDLDGTLLDSYEAIAECLNAARLAFGLPPFTHEEVVRKVGHGLESLMVEALGASHAEEGVRIFRDRYRVVSLVKSRLLPGVEPTLAELARRGYRMGVLTNKPAYFSRRILDHLKVSAYFPVLYGPDLAPAKPSPEMVRLCLKELACAREEAVLVGDMLVDWETAKNAGIPFYAIATGSESRERLLDSNPDRFLDRFEDLLLYLPDISHS
jgi:phosphoglycolate phosphatase